MRTFAILFVLLLCTGCKTTQVSITQTEWKLVQMLGDDLSGTNPPITLTLDETGKVSGHAGCNRFFGSYQSTDNSITFSGFGSTKMFCKDKMTVEDKYLKALGTVQSFKSDGTKLYFSDGSTVILEFNK